MPTLVLASKSPSRRAILVGAGITPHVVVSDVDEPTVTAASGATSGRDVAGMLARAKAEDVAVRHFAKADADTYVLGCDSVLDIDGVSYGKPHTAEAARRQWEVMRARSAVLYSGHWLIGRSKAVGAVSATTVHIANVTDAEIDAYIATGEPLEVAGALTIDGLGGPYVAGISGDHHGVLGLSLPLLRELFLELGVEWHTLWDSRGGPDA